MTEDGQELRMAPCPKRPNCVSSDAGDESRYVAPFRPCGNLEEAWTELKKLVETLPRTQIVVAESSYMRVEVRSRVFRFVDEVEFQLRAIEGAIAVRSASRVGYYDLGANRKRIEGIRDLLRSRGVLDQG